MFQQQDLTQEQTKTLQTTASTSTPAPKFAAVQQTQTITSGPHVSSGFARGPIKKTFTPTPKLAFRQKVNLGETKTSGFEGLARNYEKSETKTSRYTVGPFEGFAKRKAYSQSKISDAKIQQQIDYLQSLKSQQIPTTTVQQTEYKPAPVSQFVTASPFLPVLPQFSSTVSALTTTKESIIRSIEQLFETKKNDFESNLKKYEQQLTAATSSEFDKVIAKSRISLEKERLSKLAEQATFFRTGVEQKAISAVYFVRQADNIKSQVNNLYSQLALAKDQATSEKIFNQINDFLKQYQTAYENATLINTELKAISLSISSTFEAFVQNVTTRYLSEVEKPSLLQQANQTTDQTLKTSIQQFALYNQVTDPAVVSNLVSQITTLEQRLQDAQTKNSTSTSLALQQNNVLISTLQGRLAAAEEQNQKLAESERTAIGKLNKFLEALNNIPQLQNKVVADIDQATKAITDALKQPNQVVTQQALNELQTLVSTQKQSVIQGTAQLLNNFQSLKIATWKSTDKSFDTIEKALAQFTNNPIARKLVMDFLDNISASLPQLSSQLKELKNRIALITSSPALQSVENTILFNKNLQEVVSFNQDLSFNVSKLLESRNFALQQELLAQKTQSKKDTDALQKQYDDLLEKQAALQSQLSTTKSEREGFLLKIRQLELLNQGKTTEFIKLQDTVTNLREQIRLLDEQKAEFQKQINLLKIQEQNTTVPQQIAQLKKDAADLQQRVKENEALYAKNLKEYEAKLKLANESIVLANVQSQTQTGTFNQDIAKLRQQNETLQKQAQSFESEKAKYDKAISDLNAKVLNAQQGSKVSTDQISAVNSELIAQKQKNEQLKKAFGDLDVELAKANPNIATLEGVVDKLKNLDNVGAPLQKLLGQLTQFKAAATQNNQQLQQRDQERRLLENQVVDLQKQAQTLQSQNTDATNALKTQQAEVSRLKEVVGNFATAFSNLNAKAITGLTQQQAKLLPLLSADTSVKTITDAANILLTNFETQKALLTTQATDKFLQLYKKRYPELIIDPRLTQDGRPNGFHVKSSQNVDEVFARTKTGVYDNAFDFSKLPTGNPDPMKFLFGAPLANQTLDVNLKVNKTFLFQDYVDLLQTQDQMVNYDIDIAEGKLLQSTINNAEKARYLLNLEAKDRFINKMHDIFLGMKNADVQNITDGQSVLFKASAIAAVHQIFLEQLNKNDLPGGLEQRISVFFKYWSQQTGTKLKPHQYDFVIAGLSALQFAWSDYKRNTKDITELVTKAASEKRIATFDDLFKIVTSSEAANIYFSRSKRSIKDFFTSTGKPDLMDLFKQLNIGENLLADDQFELADIRGKIDDHMKNLVRNATASAKKKKFQFTKE